MKHTYAEYIFFFSLFGIVTYIMWAIFAPFMSALLLAAIIATVAYPFHRRILAYIPKRHETGGALISVVLIACTIFIPLIIISYMLFTQAKAFYDVLASSGVRGLEGQVALVEDIVGGVLPGFAFDITEIVKQGASWLASHMGSIFAGTASTIFTLFITFITLFYLLRDGPHFAQNLVRLSPLQDEHDQYILDKLALSVRSVVLGTLVVALIQGVLTGIGFALFGFNEYVLWGSVAAIGALIPGVGTGIVFAAAVVHSLITGFYLTALFLAIWGVFAVGLIDNFLGPYLMSRGAALHPFAVLISVLGGIAFFGPIGFLVGPVALSFFIVLLELYTTHIRPQPKKRN